MFPTTRTQGYMGWRLANKPGCFGMFFGIWTTPAHTSGKGDDRVNMAIKRTQINIELHKRILYHCVP